MRFTLMLSRGEYRDFHAIARTAEASGFSSITMPDSLFFPRATESVYPYADTDEFHSENYDIGLMKMNPVPDKPVPILYGGHSNAALARAARLCDGWISANADTDTLKSLVKQLNVQRERYGTLNRPDFEIHVMDISASNADDFRRLADFGATDMVTGFAGESQQMLDQIRRFGDKIIAKLES